MNDDYLWDRTGRPDEGVQRLEELLGTLRYEPRPLAVPNAAPVRTRLRLGPGLAIAATIMLAVLIAGVWLVVHRKGATLPTQAKTLPAEQEPTGPRPVENVGVPRENAPRPLKATQPRETQRHAMARNTHRQPSLVIASSELSADEIAAKDQLLLALRVASSKLNLAQRRTQTTTPPPTTIRNQHRIG